MPKALLGWTFSSTILNCTSLLTLAKQFGACSLNMLETPTAISPHLARPHAEVAPQQVSLQARDSGHWDLARNSQ